MLRFNEDFAEKALNKSLCECWYCGYCPLPGATKKDISELPEEIKTLAEKKVYCKGYFTDLDEIYDAFKFEFTYYLYRYKAREDSGYFTFKGNEYTFAYVYDLESDLCWVEIKDSVGNILYGKDTKAYKYYFDPDDVWGEPIEIGYLEKLPF